MFFFPFSYWWVIVPGIILTVWAQIHVKSTYSKFSKVKNSRNITGAEIARRILNAYGLEHIEIEMIEGQLTDHYDPRAQIVRLSKGIYTSTSVAALGIAAHEVGHAIQHSKSYIPLTLRNLVYPVASIGSNLGPILIIVGFIMAGFQLLIQIGIILFAFAVVFSLITLPVEFNASRRAITILRDGEILAGDELKGAKKVLNAAAMTYLAAALVAILTLLRFIFLSRD